MSKHFQLAYSGGNYNSVLAHAVIFCVANSNVTLCMCIRNSHIWIVCFMYNVHVHNYTDLYIDKYNVHVHVVLYGYSFSIVGSVYC